jgi:hypothetical protein
MIASLRLRPIGNQLTARASLLAAALAAPAAANVINVPLDQPTIQAAINVAVAGDEIVVAPGIYSERINFSGVVGPALAKDITVRSSGGPAVTIIDATGVGAGAVVTMANTLSTTIFNFDCELDGFTVRGGVTAGTNGNGGGFVLGGANGIRVLNCIVEDNTATGRGGGMLVSNGGVLVRNTLFRSNLAGTTANGGAVAVSGTNTDTNIGTALFEDCVFESNEADGTGGAVQIQGLRNATFRRCRFTANRTSVTSTSNNGGAIHITESGFALIDQCEFNENLAARANGGAIHIATNTAAAGAPIARATITNCKFIANNADVAGGAILCGSNTTLGLVGQPTLIANCLLASNSAGRVGGGSSGLGAALFVGGTLNAVELINCTVVNNVGLDAAGLAGFGAALNNGGAPSFKVANCVVRNNLVAAQLTAGGAPVTALSYSNVQGLLSLPFALGPGNIDAAPLFADPDGLDNVSGTPDDNFDLVAGSPGVDAGDNASVPAALTTDLGGKARRFDDSATPDTGAGTAPLVDMGAYEFGFACAVTNYCTAGTTTNGCSAAISGAGLPSASAPSGFTLSVANVEGQKQGLIFYGVSGGTALPWFTGSTSLLCVKSPTQRMNAQLSGGVSGACNGSFSADWNAFRFANPSALGQPFSAGDEVRAQAWFRDPPAPKTTNLSNAAAFTLCP